MVGLAAPDLLGGGKVAGAIAFQPRLILRETGELGAIGGRFLAYQLINRKGGVLALHFDPVELAKHKAVADCRRRVGSDDDATAVILRYALQPRGDVHCFTDRRIIVAFWRADIANHRRPGVETDLDRVTRHAAPVGIRFCLHHTCDNAQSRPRCASRMVGIGHRRTEYRHHRVADKLVDIAAERLDRFDHESVIGVGQRHQLFRGEPG